MTQDRHSADSLILRIADIALPDEAAEDLRESMDDLTGGNPEIVDLGAAAGMMAAAGWERGASNIESKGYDPTAAFRELADARSPGDREPYAVDLREVVNENAELVAVRLLVDVPPTNVDLFYNDTSLLIQIEGRTETTKTLPFTPGEVEYITTPDDPHTEAVIEPERDAQSDSSETGGDDGPPPEDDDDGTDANESDDSDGTSDPEEPDEDS